MGLKGKLEAEVELKQSSGDHFYDMFGHKPHHLSKSCSTIKSVDVHQGEFGKVGSIVHWNYSVGGKAYFAKDRIEYVDNVNKRVVYRVIEGDLMNDYKEFIFNIQVTPKRGGCDLVKWTIDFTKHHEQVPDPKYMLDLVLSITAEVDNNHRQLQACAQ